MISDEDLLFIEPKGVGASSALVDTATRRMAAAFRQAEAIQPYYCGFYVCVCGACSGPQDLQLPNDRKINSLCVHYLAYHRDEVPLGQLQEVEHLPFGEVEPSEQELEGIRMVQYDELPTELKRQLLRETENKPGDLLVDQPPGSSSSSP